MSVEALKCLEFNYIYLDDKSFGQAGNWRSTGHIHERVLSYNPKFQGFVVQTPPTIAAKGTFLAEAVALGPRFGDRTRGLSIMNS